MQASFVGSRQGHMGVAIITPIHRPDGSRLLQQAKPPVALRKSRSIDICSMQSSRSLTHENAGEQSPCNAASTRRSALLGSLAAVVASSSLVGSPLPALARGPSFKSAGGIEYYDAAVGKGGETFDGDTIKITFTAHTFDTETGEKLKTFDPFINGGGGSSMTKGFKLTLGGSNGDVPAGLNLGIVGGDGVEPMQKGGKRILRIPPELAYGSAGHHCYLGMKDQCEVPPNTPVEIEVEFVGFV